MTARRAIFMDRDGTVIEDQHYAKDPEAVMLVSGAGTVLSRLQSHGFALSIISNQSGVGRGLITDRDVMAVHARMQALLEEFDVGIDSYRYCLHAPDAGCECRKPKLKMVQESASELGVDLGLSYFIGDKVSDVETGRGAGCTSIYLSHGNSALETGADHVVSQWSEIGELILKP